MDEEIKLLLKRVLKRLDNIEMSVFNNSVAIHEVHKSIFDMSDNALKKYNERQRRKEYICNHECDTSRSLSEHGR